MEFENKEHITEVRIDFQEEINTLIPKPSGCFWYSGISSIAIFCILGLLVSYWIKYPEIITVEAEIVTRIPTLDQYAGVSGKIEHMFVNDRDTVEMNKRIIVFKSNANWRDIDATYELINFIFSKSQNIDILNIQFPKNMMLGSVQNQFEESRNSLLELQYLLNDSSTNLRIASINSEINIIKKIFRSNQKELLLFKKELGLVLKETDRHNILKEDGIISTAESEKVIQKSIQGERQFESMKSNIFRLESQIINLENQKQVLMQSREKEILEKMLIFKQTIVALQTIINEWKQKYEIVSGANGIISFAAPYVINQQVKLDQILFSIIPIERENPIIATCRLESIGYGKVLHGQRVIIEVYNYPAKEFGRITGKVIKTAILPQKSGDNNNLYSVEIAIGDSLITDYGKHIPFLHKMNSRAKIITKEERLIVRLFENIRRLINY